MLTGKWQGGEGYTKNGDCNVSRCKKRRRTGKAERQRAWKEKKRRACATKKKSEIHLKWGIQERRARGPSRWVRGLDVGNRKNSQWEADNREPRSNSRDKEDWQARQSVSARSWGRLYVSSSVSGERVRTDDVRKIGLRAGMTGGGSIDQRCIERKAVDWRWSDSGERWRAPAVQRRCKIRGGTHTPLQRETASEMMDQQEHNMQHWWDRGGETCLEIYEK